MIEMKAMPLKRPHDYLNHEHRDGHRLYLCPNCNTLYQAYVNVGICYPNEIDRSREGIVVRTEYWCYNCHDYAFEVDPQIAKTVQLLIKHGITTISSCSGHAEKYDQCCFEQEWCLGGTTEDTITYGACISMIEPDKEDEVIAFTESFSHFQEKNKHSMMLIHDDANKPFFFIAPVLDVKEFRKCGDIRRQKFIDNCNERMYAFVEEFIKYYEKKKRERIGKQ